MLTTRLCSGSEPRKAREAWWTRKKERSRLGAHSEDGDRHEDIGKEQREEVMVTGGNIRVDNQKVTEFRATTRSRRDC